MTRNKRVGIPKFKEIKLVIKDFNRKIYELDGSQAFTIVQKGVRPDGHLNIWDWNDAVLREVSFGADDSGGAGYKVLRVPN